MPKISYEQDEEYRRLKTQRDAMDQLMSKMTAYEAAIKVLARHGLMIEFAEEITATAATTAAVSNSDAKPE